VIAALALVGPQVVGDPYKQSLLDRLQVPGFAGGNASYPLGTDQLGRDVLARLAYGTRLSLMIAVIAVCISGILGVVVGLYAGFYGGWAGRIVMRATDIQLAFPFILFAILVVGALGPGIRNVVFVLGVSGWVLYARVVRGDVLRLRELEYVASARAVGVRDHTIIFRHILPNALPPVIVIATSATAQMIISEAALSFLGVGVQPPDPSLGTMLSDGREYLTIDPWLATVPGIAIMIAVLGINLLGDWLRDVLDPKMTA
jgi:peptide/nickel transport system permease protein